MLYGRTLFLLRTKMFGLIKFRAVHNINRHPSKCLLFAASVRRCSRTISTNSIRSDPDQLDGLPEIEEPTSDAHLQQFIHAIKLLKHETTKDFTLII